jgi:hypothetical protein
MHLEIDARAHFPKRGALALGAGIGVLDDAVDVTSANGLNWTTAPSAGVVTARAEPQR